MSRRLLDRYEIPTRTVSYHARSGPSRERELLAHLAGGADLALVTDAGTPVVSDPGEGLVAAWAAAGGTVVADPGRVVRAGGASPRRVSRVRAGRSRGSCRDRVATAASGSRGSPPTSAGRCCSRRRTASRPRSATSPPPAATIDRAPCAASSRSCTSRSFAGRSAPSPRSSRTARSRPGGSSSSWSVRRTRPSRVPTPSEEALLAARAEVDSLVAGGAPRSEAARTVAAATGLPRRDLYRP